MGDRVAEILLKAGAINITGQAGSAAVWAGWVDALNCYLASRTLGIGEAEANTYAKTKTVTPVTEIVADYRSGVEMALLYVSTVATVEEAEQIVALLGTQSKEMKPNIEGE